MGCICCYRTKIIEKERDRAVDDMKKLEEKVNATEKVKRQAEERADDFKRRVSEKTWESIYNKAKEMKSNLKDQVKSAFILMFVIHLVRNSILIKLTFFSVILLIISRPHKVLSRKKLSVTSK